MALPLTAYIEAAMESATFDKLGDGTFSGEIPELDGVISFGGTLKECQNELRSTLEDWILVGLQLRHVLPPLGGIDLSWNPIKRRDFVRKLLALGFTGLFRGTKHQFLAYAGKGKPFLRTASISSISLERSCARLSIRGREISADEWNAL